MNISMKAAVVALVAMSGGSALAQTTTVNFTYSGTGDLGPNSIVSSGSGSFSFVTGPTAIGISSLTAFSFSVSRDIPGLNFTSTYTYGLSNLQVFAANFTPSGDINELAFQTNRIAPSVSNAPGGSLGFRITSWTTGTSTGAGQLYRFEPGGVGFTADSAGTVTVTSVVPAPGAAALLGAGGLLAARRRRA